MNTNPLTQPSRITRRGDSQKDEATELLAGFGKFVLGTIYIFTGIIWRGLILSVLWNWFVAGLFNIPRLNIGEALGLVLVVVFFLVGLVPDPNKGKFFTMEKIIGTYFGPLFSLIFGAVLHYVFNVGA